GGLRRLRAECSESEHRRKEKQPRTRGPAHLGEDAQAGPSTRTLKWPMADPGPSATSPENAFAAGLFEDLPPRYDRLAGVLSLGQNGRWRREVVRPLARSQPRRILNVATGTAGGAIALARATEADIVGVDISEPMLERGRKLVYAAGLDQKIRLQHGRAEELPFPDASFDAVSFTYLLRYVADPAAALVELTRVLRPAGGMASLDFHVPSNPMWRASWRVYTRALMPSAGYALGGRAWWAPAWRGGSTSRVYSPPWSRFFSQSGSPRMRSTSCAGVRCKPQSPRPAYGPPPSSDWWARSLSVLQACRCWASGCCPSSPP